MGRLLLCNSQHWNVWGTVTLASGDDVQTIYMHSCTNCPSLMLNSMENHLCCSAFEERTGFKYLIGFLTVRADLALRKQAALRCLSRLWLLALDKLSCTRVTVREAHPMGSKGVGGPAASLCCVLVVGQLSAVPSSCSPAGIHPACCNRQ